MKNQLYTICLGIGLNMFMPEFKTFGRMPETKSKFI